MKKQTPPRHSVQRRPTGRNSQPKRRYHLRNWKEYNAALVQRGSLTFWIDEAALAGWCNTTPSGKRGASCLYSEVAITAALTLKVVYHLPLRGAQGMLASLLSLMGLEHLPVPDYSTLSRRQRSLAVPLHRDEQWLQQARANGAALHLVVDSTGCKIFGEGEWKVRQHGIGKRRTWRKLHLGVDEASGMLVAAVLSTNNVADSEVVTDLLEQVPVPLAQFSGDGGYDKRSCYEVLRERAERQDRALRVAIPPQRRARIWQHGNCKGQRLARDENLRHIRQVGRARWKQESGYHRRSLAETAMFRQKTIFGSALKARGFEAQACEAFIRCAALNRMTQCGMPDSYAV